jgi:adenine-specific DNA-methyltransferase
MSNQQVNQIEARRQAVQTAMDAKKSAAERNRLGQFATPNTLAIDIVRYIESLAGRRLQMVRLADPAFGTGSFYSAALAVFGRARIKTAIGVEVDADYCEAARDLWGEEGLEIVRGDFTRLVASTNGTVAPNLILANPPYVRHHHLEREQKEYLHALTYRLAGVRVNGLAGLYVYFLILATAWMEEGGYAAWLVPSEFMDVNYGAALKRFLIERVTLIRAHRFDPQEVQFEDALVSSVVLVFRKVPALAGHRAEFTFGGTFSSPQAREWLPLDQLRASRKWTVYPSHPSNDRRTSSGGNGPVLGDFFRIQRGIATGSNKFFILERREAEKRGLPKSYLRPILPSPRLVRATVIDADDAGYPLLDPQLCLIDCDLPEDVLPDRFPALWEYLQTAASLGLKDRYLIRKRFPWYR